MSPRVHLFGVDIDVVSMPDAVQRVLRMAKESPDSCRFVLTPNAHHVLLLQKSEGLRRAYVDASLVIADGWPVVLAARLLGQPLPGRVSGSDLVPALFEAASPEQPLRVFLLGGAPGIADQARARAEAWYPGVRVVGTCSPPPGFERDTAETERILERIAVTEPEVLVLGLGAPKQELWVHAHRDRIGAQVALCVGATIDFLAGAKRRAPRFMQRVGLEWLYRVILEPTRLGPRYAAIAIGFPILVLREWRRR